MTRFDDAAPAWWRLLAEKATESLRLVTVVDRAVVPLTGVAVAARLRVKGAIAAAAVLTTRLMTQYGRRGRSIRVVAVTASGAGSTANGLAMAPSATDDDVAPPSLGRAGYRGW